MFNSLLVFLVNTGKHGNAHTWPMLVRNVFPWSPVRLHLQQIKNAHSFLFLTSAQERKKKNIWCLESDNITLTVSRLKATDCAHCCDWSPSLKLILELTPLSEEREMLLFDGDRGNVRLSSASALQNLRKALMCTQSYFDLLILTHLHQAWNTSE